MATQRPTKKGSKSNKSKKIAVAAQTAKVTAEKTRQEKTKRFFTVLISVIVVLGLMVPVAGIGVLSCSSAQDAATPAPVEDFASTSE